MIKALFFDIDGTLVSFNTHAVPESTVQALTAAKAKGIRIFIATGRPSVIINNLGSLQLRGLIDGYITMNGAYCFVGSDVIYKSAIPAHDVCTLARISAQENFPCIFVSERDICVCQPDDMVKKVFNDYLKVNTIPEKTPEEAVQQEIFQMTPFITLEQEERILPQLPDCMSGRWFPAFTDITARGITKQRGIDEMLQYFGLDLRNSMAFGDGGNDICMLSHVAIGVAMDNASDEVKQHADYVTSSVDEDGIAAALRRFSII